jgi:plastocyanin
MEYSAQPDKRLVAVVLIVVVAVPGLIAAELAVPSLQPRFVAGGGTSGGGTPTGGGGGTPSTIVGVKVVMPNGVNLQKTLNFQPADITLVVGVNNSVTWTNQDSTDHTVTFTAVPGGVTASSMSSDVPPGTSFGPITFTVPGTYQYHCQFHPGWMRGTIVVKAA